MKKRILIAWTGTCVAAVCLAQAPPQPVEPAVPAASVEQAEQAARAAPSPAPERSLVPRSNEPAAYALGPGDKIIIRVPGVEEFPRDPAPPIPIGRDGSISLPLVGRIQAGGRTMEQLEAEIKARLAKYVREPQVSISIAEFQSRPVSVFGAVAQPGVHQLEGPKTLYEVISLAGGFTKEVGDTIRITRRLENGELPLPGARVDKSGRYSIAELSVRDLLTLQNPEDNILIMPHDVISVSRATIIYVVGDVAKGGGFITDKGTLSVLEAISLAGGFQPHASAKDARILRVKPGTDQRTQIAVNLKKVLKGEAEDILLRPDDILFVPHSGFKAFTSRSLAAAVAVTTGIAIYRVGLGR